MKMEDEDWVQAEIERELALLRESGFDEIDDPRSTNLNSSVFLTVTTSDDQYEYLDDESNDNAKDKRDDEVDLREILLQEMATRHAEIEAFEESIAHLLEEVRSVDTSGFRMATPQAIDSQFMEDVPEEIMHRVQYEMERQRENARREEERRERERKRRQEMERMERQLREQEEKWRQLEEEAKRQREEEQRRRDEEERRRQEEIERLKQQHMLELRRLEEELRIREEEERKDLEMRIQEAIKQEEQLILEEKHEEAKKFEERKREIEIQIQVEREMRDEKERRERHLELERQKQEERRRKAEEEERQRAEERKRVEEELRIIRQEAEERKRREEEERKRRKQEAERQRLLKQQEELERQQKFKAAQEEEERRKRQEEEEAKRRAEAEAKQRQEEEEALRRKLEEEEREAQRKRKEEELERRRKEDERRRKQLVKAANRTLFGTAIIFRRDASIAVAIKKPKQQTNVLLCFWERDMTALLKALKQWQVSEKHRGKSRDVKTTIVARSTIHHPRKGKPQRRTSGVTLDDEMIAINCTDDGEISSLPKLIHADLTCNEISRLAEEGFPNCSNLRSMVLNVNYITSNDLRCLHKNPKLEELLVDDNELEDFQMLDTVCPNLRVLSAKTNKLQSIAGLQSCVQLRQLDVSNNSLSSLIEGGTSLLYHCTNIEHLVLYRNHLPSLEGLERLEALNHLDAGRNHIKEFDLSHHRLLQTLIMYENEIATFPPLQHNVLLHQLWLNGNRISPSVPGTTLFAPLLDTLNLQENLISSIEPLVACPMLRSLNISFNNIDSLYELKALRYCKRLQEIRINDNPICLRKPKSVRKALILMLPRLRSIDSQEIQETERSQIESFAFSSHKQALRQAMTFVNQSVRQNRPLMYSNAVSFAFQDQQPTTTSIRWNAIMEQRLPAADSTTTAWESLTYDYLCNTQQKERLQMSIAQRRALEKYTNVKRTTLKDPQETHRRILDLKQKHAEQFSAMLQQHYSQQLQFTPANYQRVLSKNPQYHQRQVEFTSARFIQTWLRFAILRRKQKLSKYATKIQAAWRGYRTRFHSNAGVAVSIHLNKWKRQRIEMQRMRYWAAVKIQAMWRGYKTRKMIKCEAKNNVRNDDSDDDDEEDSDEESDDESTEEEDLRVMDLDEEEDEVFKLIERLDVMTLPAFDAHMKRLRELRQLRDKGTTAAVNTTEDTVTSINHSLNDKEQAHNDEGHAHVHHDEQDFEDDVSSQASELSPRDSDRPKLNPASGSSNSRAKKELEIAEIMQQWNCDRAAAESIWNNNNKLKQQKKRKQQRERLKDPNERLKHITKVVERTRPPVSRGESSWLDSHRNNQAATSKASTLTSSFNSTTSGPLPQKGKTTLPPIRTTKANTTITTTINASGVVDYDDKHKRVSSASSTVSSIDLSQFESGEPNKRLARVISKGKLPQQLQPPPAIALVNNFVSPQQQTLVRPPSSRSSTSSISSASSSSSSFRFSGQQPPLSPLTATMGGTTMMSFSPSSTMSSPMQSPLASPVSNGNRYYHGGTSSVSSGSLGTYSALLQQLPSPQQQYHHYHYSSSSSQPTQPMRPPIALQGLHTSATSAAALASKIRVNNLALLAPLPSSTATASTPPAVPAGAAMRRPPSARRTTMRR